MRKQQYCNNCGRQGHIYNKCKHPITSVGIIAFRPKAENIEYLMICRRHSLGFVDFMRGKYSLYNYYYLQNLIDEMTIQEKQNLLTYNFHELWKNLWGNFEGVKYHNEEDVSYTKFEKIKIGISLKNINYNLKMLIENSSSNWATQEWGFPKGRRNYQENDINCALREFEEETGYNKKDVKVIKNLMPLEEIFTGSNLKSYKHKYFLAYIDNNIFAII